MSDLEEASNQITHLREVERAYTSLGGRLIRGIPISHADLPARVKCPHGGGNRCDL
jgi:hypothetical protein